MKKEKRDFDKGAASWDDNPLRLKLANDVFNSLSREIELLPTMDVMDFGCGTGLLTLRLCPLVRSITGFDSSQGMLEVFRKKIVQKNLGGVEVHHIDMDKGGRLSGLYHLIVSSMTMHHIEDVRSLLGQFYQMLHPSGHLCLADLNIDNGKFHDDHTGVFHHGFDTTALHGLFKEAGFEGVRDIQAARVAKTGSDGVMREFSVFLMIGRKNALPSP